MTMTEKVRGYRLQERAGQDGPWSAYLATADRDGASVLLRTLACRRVDKRRLKPLLRGFRFPDALAAHPNVIPVLDLGTTADGRPYLVTHLPGGCTLAERPGRSLPAPPAEALRIARAVASALAATHAAGGVHGDIRPENVVLPEHREPALTGYGMSGLMSLAELPDGTSVSVHTPPELLEGRSASPASDVYSFGSMLYELLAGRAAFAMDGPDTSARFVFGVLSEEPPPLAHRSLPLDLVTAVHQAMSKPPDARPTAADLAARFAQTALPALKLVAPPSLLPPSQPGPGLPPSQPEPGLPPVRPGLGMLPSQAGSGLPPVQAVPGLSPSLTGPGPSYGGPPLAPGLSQTGPGPLPGAAQSGAGALSAGPEPLPGASQAGPPPPPPLPPSTSMPMPSMPVAAEASVPRALVWTVDPDRSASLPAPPRPLYPSSYQPQPGTAEPQAPAEPRRRSKKVPLFIAGTSGLAVLIGAASIAAAMNGRPASSPRITLEPQSATTGGTDSGTGGTDPTTGGTDSTTTAKPPDSTAATPPPSALPSALPSTGPSIARPAKTLDAAALSAQRPKDLKLVTDNGSTVTLSWKQQRKSDFPMVIQQSPGERMMSMRSGSSTFTVAGLDAATGYCFKVGTVVRLGQPSSVAWSPSLCIRGAVETDPGSQDEQVQPPIVLPLATPPT
ncbi:protein kinase [Nonomuraea sp. NPDC026600]|uniref:protein kinase domain-containing protein n=1 Tax=Nonomuraea sp. NPDC026600 TaxID=3155363 RepID=UPI0033F60CC6